MDLGEVKPLVAGEARDGGGGRNSSSGDQMAGGGQLRDAEDPARRVVRSVRPGATYIDGGELKGGGRRSVVAAGRARGHGRLHGWARSAPGRVLSMLPCSGVSYGGSSTVCVIAGGEERSAPTARVVRGRGRHGERGEMDRGSR